MADDNRIGNNNNLIPLASRPTAEQAEIRRKGGIANGAARRLKKSLREQLIIALELTNKETGKEYSDDMVVAILKKAMAGNVKAFEVVRDTIGERPIEQHEIEGIQISLGDAKKYAD